MKHLVLAATALSLTLAGCSSKEEAAEKSPSGMSAETRGDMQTMDVAEDYAPPSVSPTAAPGVAFKYSYDYQLDDGRISGVQEAHAARCEALGVMRCRITGLVYSLGEDDRVTANLQLKLSPELAREFGKDATADVVKASGRLFRTEFEGEDTAPTTRAAQQDRSNAATRIAELEKQIADPRTRDQERTELRRQLAELRDRAASSSATVAEQEERLASTPMTMTYYGSGGITGFGHENPVKEALKLFVASAVTMISFLLRIIAAVLPWALLLLLLIFIARLPLVRKGWRWLRPKTEDSEG